MDRETLCTIFFLVFFNLIKEFNVRFLVSMGKKILAKYGHKLADFAVFMTEYGHIIIIMILN